MRKINKETVNAILKKTPFAHSSDPYKEGLSESQIKGLFYKAITDPKNSVISEINRIVTEGNAELSQINGIYSFGKVENCPLQGVKEQFFIGSNVLDFYKGVPFYTLQELGDLKDIFNINVGGNYIFLRVTAPEDVIPDDDLTLTVGDTDTQGLELLSSSAEDAINGVYYIDFCVNANGLDNQTVKIKWNAEQEENSILLDLSAESKKQAKQTFVRFAVDQQGTGFGSVWSADKRYVGFLYSNNASTSYQDYQWVKIAKEPVKTSITLTVNGWENSSQTVNVQSVQADSYVLCSPNAESIDDYQIFGVRCISQGTGILTFSCRETPSSAITVDLLIGE